MDITKLAARIAEDEQYAAFETQGEGGVPGKYSQMLHRVVTHRQVVEAHRAAGDRCVECRRPWPCPTIQDVAAEYDQCV